MKKIDKRFIEEALNIRESYLNNLSNVIKYEKEIKEINDNLLISYKELEDNNVDISTMDNRIKKLSEDINKLQNLLNPLVNITKELEKRSDILYESIMNKYNDLNKDDISNIILPYLSKIDEKFEDILFKNSN